MAARNHYETLGVSRTATSAEIRSAHRRLVLRHHPDRSKDPKSPAIFMAVTEAYQVLSDPKSKESYDRGLQAHTAPRAAPKPPTAQPRAEPPRTATKTKASTPDVASEITRLAMLFTKGRHAECETLAKTILHHDPRQPVPYAVLGDLARNRRDYNEAARYYSLALQMDPRNPVYLQRYEAILQRSAVVTNSRDRAKLQVVDERLAPMAVAGVVLFSSALYVMIAPEKAAFSSLGFVSSWTLGLVVMLFLTGVTTGACLAVANLLDRLDVLTAGTAGVRSPSVALGLIAFVSFPAAAALYGMLGFFQRSFNYSTTRMISAVAVITVVLALAGSVSGISSVQTILWGGNLAYLGALLGWLVSDSFRS